MIYIIHHLISKEPFERELNMKQDVKCPYMRNGVCYHSHCIYKPNLKCNKPFNELKWKHWNKR